jgi:hypothetical protein
MSIIQRDYLPERTKVEFPPELALLIVRKAAAMATTFEGKALDQMTRDARRELQMGRAPGEIVRMLGL